MRLWMNFCESFCRKSFNTSVTTRKLLTDDYFGITEPSQHPSLSEIPRAVFQSTRPIMVIDQFLSENLTQFDLRTRLYWTARNLREAVRLVRPNYLWDMSD